MYCATHDGLYRGTSSLSSARDGNGNSIGWKLEQNYPNPFNPASLIRYTVAGGREYGGGSTETKIVVSDILGRDVATLVNENQAPGSYEVRFDATGLASGVYFYRLMAGSFVETRSMLLVK